MDKYESSTDYGNHGLIKSHQIARTIVVSGFAYFDLLSDTETPDEDTENVLSADPLVPVISRIRTQIETHMKTLQMTLIPLNL